MRLRMDNCILLIVILLGFGCTLSAQIPTNTENRICVNEELIEDFGPDVPLGWEGDWMLTMPPLTEGWILQSGPSPDAPGTGADDSFSGGLLRLHGNQWSGTYKFNI